MSRDVQDQRGLLHFFERGAKRGHQALGEIANESDRVGKQHAAIRGQAHGAHGGIERREHFRRDQHVGAAERVEQRGFAGVGVADQSHRAERHGLARLAAQRALPAQRFDVLADAADALANAAAIGFEFLFAGTARADAAAQARELLGRCRRAAAASN